MLYLVPKVYYCANYIHEYFTISSTNTVDVNMYRSEIWPLPGIY